jgi:hypothetical protein
MRSRYALVHLLLVLSLMTAVSIPQQAEAGFFKNTYKTIVNFFKRENRPTQGGTGTGTPKTTRQNFSVVSTINGDFVDLIEKRFDSVRENRLFNNIFFESKQVEMIDAGSNEHVRIRAEYRESGLMFILEYDAIAKQDPALLLKPYVFFESFYAYKMTKLTLDSNLVETSFKSNFLFKLFQSDHGLVELLNDAHKGNLPAQYRLAQIEELMLRDLKFKDGVNHPDIHLGDADLVALHAQSVDKIKVLEPLAEAYLKQQEKSLQKWREKTQILEFYESSAAKLNDLVTANDRKGVRQMLEAYLPWALMQPTEVQTWKMWLDSIEKPDRSNTVVAFRGLNYKTDKVQRSRTNPENLGFLSTMLTQNQGSYTRRLRSLVTNRVHNGDGQQNQLALESPTKALSYSSMMNQFLGHSMSPQASSFLSFTYDLEVAVNFANLKKSADGKPQGAFLAVAIDQRRLFPNLTSGFTGEIELLAPLIVFPDEVVGFQEGLDLDLTFDDKKRNFLAKVSESTGLSVESMLNYSKQNAELKAEYKTHGFKFFNAMMSVDMESRQCSGVFL